MSAVQSNYMSDSALMAWVTEQQNRLYGELHNAMDFEESRADMASDVSDLKLALQNAAKDPAAMLEVGAALDAFRAKYGDVAEFSQMREVVDGIEAATRPSIDRVKAYEASQFAENAEASGLSSSASGTDAAAATNETWLEKIGAGYVCLDQALVDGWVKALGEQADASNQNQQLGMIHIGEIKSSIDQSSNLVSQLVKSGNDATSSIINNF
jgi:hypothetical protein